MSEFCSEMTRTDVAGPASVVGWKLPLLVFSSLMLMQRFFFFYLKEARLGMVVRDSRGEVHWSVVKKVGQVFSPLQAELKAICFGLEEIAGFSF